MSRYAIFALAALAACSGPDDKGDSGLESGTGVCPDGVFTGPVMITSYSVTCDANGVAAHVETQGWTANGRLYMQDTAYHPAWGENHELFSYEFDECQEWDHLAFGPNGTETLTPTDDAAAQEPNVSTLYDCDYINGANGDPSPMSYAAQVDDLDGNPAHCIAWGDDPQGMIDNTASQPEGRSNEPAFDLSGCEIGTAAM